MILPRYIPEVGASFLFVISHLEHKAHVRIPSRIYCSASDLSHHNARSARDLHRFHARQIESFRIAVGAYCHVCPPHCAISEHFVLNMFRYVSRNMSSFTCLCGPCSCSPVLEQHLDCTLLQSTPSACRSPPPELVSASPLMKFLVCSIGNAVVPAPCPIPFQTVPCLSHINHARLLIDPQADLKSATY